MFGGGTTNTTVRIMTRRIVGLSAVAGLGAIVYSQYFTKDGNPLSSISTHSFLSQTLMASDNSASSTSHLNDSESILAHSKAFQNESKPISLWTPPSRADMLKRIKEKGPEGEFDLLVIGGGATGTGVALDAATRGLKVAMVERDDFASGTSSKSTKLVHGGVRYLEKAVFNLDYEQYKLVQEALSERYTLLKIAPYLATQLPIMCPIYKWWHVPYYYAGVKAYDIVAGSRGLESSYFLTKSKAIKEFPMLKKENLKGAVVYYDGQQNDARMNVVLALTAVYHGAVALNHVEVVVLLKDKDAILCGATLKDNLTGDQWDVKCKGIINATGPFSDKIRRMDEPECRELIAPSAGTHIVLPHYYSPNTMGLIDPATSDGRVIFFIPWEGNTVAGTTDSPTEVTDEPIPSEEEIQFILNEASHYLSPEIQVRRGDVLSAWAGIRPLVRNPNAKDTQSLVRNHLIYASASKLLTIAGGKWTTYREMAQETVDKAVELFDLQPRNGCVTEKTLLIGSHEYNPESYTRIVQHFGLETDVAQHLLHNYGDRAFAVASLATITGQRWPVMGKRVSYPYPFIEAEIRFACQREFACTTVDVIARRVRLAFLNVQAAHDALPRVIEIMAEELRWDKARCKKEKEVAIRFLGTMGLASNKEGRAVFNSDELAKFRDAFQQVDQDRDGVIGTGDLDRMMKRLGLPVGQAVLQSMIAEVDSNRNGVVDFNEFLEIMTAATSIRQRSSFAQFIANFNSQLEKPITTERSGGGV